MKDVPAITDIKSVAPHAGAWIEISELLITHLINSGRTSRRCVDWNLIDDTQDTDSNGSHLTQVRGLKYQKPKVLLW